MNLTNWRDALYMVTGVSVVLSIIYLFVGSMLTYTFSKGIKQVWIDRKEKPNIFWSYFTCLFFWPRIDWVWMEEENHRRLKDEKRERENAKEEN